MRCSGSCSRSTSDGSTAARYSSWHRAGTFPCTRRTAHAGSGRRRPRGSPPSRSPTGRAPPGAESTRRSRPAGPQRKQLAPLAARRRHLIHGAARRPRKQMLGPLPEEGEPARVGRYAEAGGDRLQNRELTAAEEPTPLPSGTLDEISRRNPRISAFSSRANRATGPRTYAAHALAEEATRQVLGRHSEQNRRPKVRSAGRRSRPRQARQA